MRVDPRVKPGFFWKAGRQYIALSEVPRMLNLTASEVADAVALGELQIERVAGCKVASFEALIEFTAIRRGKK